MSNLYSKCHKLYSLSKTLRFELKPIGKTKENFENYILTSDEEKSEKFKKVKLYCDEYHKKFINDCLENFQNDKFVEVLNKYYELYVKNNRSDKENNEFEKTQELLRKIIAETFTKNKKYKGLFGKELFKNYLPEYYKNDEEKLSEIKLFSEFTTYFAGYNKNRENMYSTEEKTTAISYRLINQNLPTYIKNIQNYNKIKEYIPTINETISHKIQVDIEKYFNLEYFENILTQDAIDKYNYIIGGKSLDNGTKIQGINEFINLYNQTNPDKKLPKLKILYKQILSDKTNVSFKIDKIENDSELISLINNYYNILSPLIYSNDNKDTGFIKTIKDITQFDTNKIWVMTDNLTYLSQQVYKDWNYINHLIEEKYNQENLKNNKKINEKFLEKRDKELKKIKEYSLHDIEQLIIQNDKNLKIKNQGKLYKYITEKTIEIINNIKLSHSECEYILNTNYEPNSKQLLNDIDKITKIKTLLDNIKLLQTTIKFLIPKSVGIQIDDAFYNAINYDILSEIIPIYNKTRNYITQKPYSIEKFPLTFNCPTLLNGWSKNKENTNLCVLFKKDELFYLGILNNKEKINFTNPQKPKNKNDIIEKMTYLTGGDMGKNIQNLISKNGLTVKVNGKKDIDGINRALEEDKNLYLPKNINEIRKKGSYSTSNPSFKKEDLINFIEYYKQRTIEYYKDYNFNFKPSKEYKNFAEFTNHTNEQSFQILFNDISAQYIDELVKNGKLFLFQIYNKDFSTYSKGTPNLHTMYWKELFDEDNLKDVVYKLNGGAEIFYRKKSIEYKITHPKNQAIKNKNELNHKKESLFQYDLIKDKRFTMDKFLFHVPITLNFKNQRLEYINELINSEIKRKTDINIIGVDRGERNLIYITVIDSNGKLLEQLSLNEIINEYKNETYKTDYHSLLDKKEKERNEARKSWGTIKNIKELKEGYMSQVIHKITDLMLKYNAIIVLEDLNSGFKNSRKKVEKQVYDKFETMLTNKLSYLINKKLDKNNDGGILNAYQLVNKETKGRQSGVLFYIPAWNTSKIDPVTGFVNLFYIKNMSIDKSKEFFNKFEDIRYNTKENFFEFDIDYSKFTDKVYGIRKNWTICTYGERIRTFRNKDKNNEWDNEEINLTEKFKNLFNQYSINLSNIQEDIQKQTDRNFFNEIIYLFKLTLQMRNSITNSEIDYILSPIKDKNGNFYDSRNKIDTLPKDADANGAYNIARKGLMLVNQIKQANDITKFKCKPITNAEWLEFVQKKDI